MREVLIAALVALPSLASAHPGHALAQTAYLTLAPGEVRLALDMTVGADAVSPLLAALDPDGDGEATGGEARAWAEGVLEEVALALDGAPVAWTFEAVEIPDLALLATGSAALTLSATAPRDEAAGAHDLTFENRHAPAETLRSANVLLEPGQGWSWDVTGQRRSANGAGLLVGYATTRE